MNIFVSARAAGDFQTLLPEAPGATAEIQWMPPGKHTVWPERFEQPIQIEVTPEIARIANAQLQEMRRAAAAGHGNWPYGDFNHEDGPQSFEALEFYWGGEDPKTGGVRLRLKWSDQAQALVRGRGYRSFSPSWRLHKDTHEFLGIGLNVGGLVNRSAFRSIATVNAKGEDNLGPLYDGTRREFSEFLPPALLKKLQKRAEENLTQLDDEFNQHLEDHPEDWELWIDYVQQLNKEQHAYEKNAVARHQIPFLVGAEIYAMAHGLDRLTAGEQYARTATGRRHYAQYCGHPEGRPLEKTNAVLACAKPYSEFRAGVQQYAQAKGIADELEAEIAFAYTAEGKNLYEAYRNSLFS